jgi:7,8-dihydropterin-6-yl-methyl-4-(beta-D-ribofuranosyl)aminobenzene 5'-phosphate synthase
MYKLLLIGLILFFCSCNQNQEDADFQKTFTKIKDNTIINLYDAFGEDNKQIEKDFGFSCILKYNGKTILFDAGSNADIFQKNVEALKIDLTQIDFAIASHAHFDHINGFDYLLEINPEVKIYFPFDLFWGANMPFNIAGTDSSIVDSLDTKMQYFDGDFKAYQFNQTGRFWKANVEYIKANQEIVPGINLITSSSPYMGYFTKYPNLGIESDNVILHKNETDNAKFIELNELSLSLSTNQGEVLIVGCSHSTIEKITELTKSYTKNEIALLYGGFHLLPYDRKTLTILSNRLKEGFGVKKVAPAHCTGHLAFKILQNHFKENYIFAGLGKTVEF